MILLWVFGKVINGVGVMLTAQGKMLNEPKLEEPEDEDSIKSTFLAFCHAFKKNKKAFGSLIVVCVILLGGGIYAKVNYDIQHAYDGLWYLEGNLEGDTFYIDGDEVYFYEINDYQNREVSFIKTEYKGELKKDKVEFYSCSYDYTSDDDYKTKKIDKTIYLTRLSNVEFKVDGKTYNRASK